MLNFIKKYKIKIILWFFIIAYILYFSYFTILRMRTLYASYFDLGIMHQTVFNTYRAIVEKDISKVLELTNPFNSSQIKRMAIHNDLLLALLSPFYFIYCGPQTLLIIQTIVLALGAWAIYKISLIIFQNIKKKQFIALVFGLSYLLYSPMERANIFEFHAVTLSTSFILFMIYFWLIKRYKLSIAFLILSLLSKEQVALTTAFFGFYTLIKSNHKKVSLLIILSSVAWFILSMFVVIPHFRGSNHFAIGYYGDFGDTPVKIVVGLIKYPTNLFEYIFHIDTFRFFLFQLGPLGFLSLLFPLQFLIALPEIFINLLSNNWNMRNIIFHYTSVIQPFVFLSSVYGARRVVNYFKKRSQGKNIELLIGCYILFFSLLFAYFKGPLPLAREKEIHPFIYPQKEAEDALFWQKTLKDEGLKISATGQLSPFFTSRRYFYIFSDRYRLADYVIIRKNEIYNYVEKGELIPVYQELINNKDFKIIYQKENFEVYKKVIKS